MFVINCNNCSMESDRFFISMSRWRILYAESVSVCCHFIVLYGDPRTTRKVFFYSPFWSGFSCTKMIWRPSHPLLDSGIEPRTFGTSELSVVRQPLKSATQPHWETSPMAIRAIPGPTRRHGSPAGYQTGFQTVFGLAASFLFNYGIGWQKMHKRCIARIRSY